MSSKPGNITAVAIIWIVSGVITISWGFGLVLAAFASIVGLICLPLSAFPFVVGVLELIFGIRLAMNPPSVARPPVFLSILEILLIFYFNVFGFIAGIASLVLISQEGSREYLSGQD